MNRHYTKVPQSLNLSCSVLCVLLLLSGSAIARAQSCQPGDLLVMVKDSQEGLIYGARISIGSGSVELATQSTAASGQVEFQQVPCGSWTVKATKEGFEDSSAPVEIRDQPAVEVTLTMHPQMNRSSLDVTDNTGVSGAEFVPKL